MSRSEAAEARRRLPEDRAMPPDVETPPVSQTGTQLGVINACSGEHVATMLRSNPISWSQ